ncbi:uncharacterized protein [Anabrus simplex]|uniref:uncharacterized protein n=1 Tax=Anabrus simplex TaxID=316456 RepID=UPI0035A34F98
MRWLLLLTLVAALFATSRTSPILQSRSEVSLRTRTSAIGGHLRLPPMPVVNGDTMLLSGAGDGKEQTVSNNNDDDDDDEDRKTLSQQIADGKYGLLQNEIYASVPERPGVISYDPNPEVPRDTMKNLGGLEQEEIWLAEDHVLVLRGGRYPDHKPNRTKPTPIWPPIDNYKAPPRQVKIPSNPKVPPPFPVQLTDDGPTQLLGPNGSKPIIIPPGNGSYFAPPFPFPPPPPGNFTPENGPIYPPPPYYGYPPPGSLPSPSPPFQPSKNQSVYGQPPFPLPPSGNFTPGNGPLPFYPFPFPPPIKNGSLYPPPPGFFPPPRNGSLFPPPGFPPPPPPFVNGSLPPGFFPPPGYFPPGAAFLPPPGSLNDTFDEDDPSIYYPPPYDFFYPRDNTTQVPPGPLVPGIILPPPPNFFAPLNVTSTTIKITTTPTTTVAPSTTTTTESPNTSISSPPTSFLSRKKKPFRHPLIPSDDTVAFNQVTTEIPLRYYSKAVNGIVISTPSPVTYVVVPVTDINVSPQSPNKQSPFFVYQTSTQSPSSINSNRVPQYPGRGGTSTTISPPLQNERAPKTSYYFYEEPHVAQGHLSETGVLKSQQGYYRNGYYYEPPTAVSTPSPQIYYNRPMQSTSPAPQVYYIPSRSSNPVPQAYYKIPPKSTADLPVYLSTPKYPTSSSPHVYYNVPTSAPPVYYYVSARPQQQQYYSAPRPSYHDVHPFKSNLQFYNSQRPHIETSRPVYQFSYDAHSLSTTTPRTPSLVALNFVSTPRPASTPRTVYEYSFEKQPSNEIGGSYTTALSPVSQQFIRPTARPQYLSKAQFVQPTVSPPYVVSSSPSSTESPQYQHSVGNPHVRPTIGPGTQFVVSTPNPQHAYYTPQDERLLDDITKKYFTIFGQKLGGGSTTPMTPSRESYVTTTPQTISLEGDIEVNYRPPLPAIEPESELIEPAGGHRINEGEIISYRLPGNGAHFYFLTPQARQRYRRRKTPR